MNRIAFYFQSRHRGLLLLLFSLTLLVYVPFIGNGFFFDDANFFSGNTPSSILHAPFAINLRWIPYVILGWISETFGYAIPHLFHLANILVHGCNVVLLFYFLKTLLDLNLPPDSKNSDWAAYLGAMFYAAHPIATYAVGYLIQFSILCATLFCLAMLITLIRGLVSNEKQWLIFSLIFYFLAVFSKEHAIMAPALAGLCVILLFPKSKISKRTLLILGLGYLLVAIFVLSRLHIGMATPYEYDAAFQLQQQKNDLSGWQLYLISVLTQASLYFKYLWLWLIPNPAWMSIDMREPLLSHWRSWQGLIDMMAFLLYGISGTVLLLRRGVYGLIGFGLLSPYLMFLVEFSVIRVQEPFVLYRSYLWMFGAMLVIAAIIAKIPSRKSIVYLATIVTILLVPLSWNRLWVFADSYRLWNDAARLIENKDVSGASRIYFNRGKLALDAKHWEDAISDFSRVIAINPEVVQSYVHLGTAYSALNEYEEALVNFDKAIDLNPEYTDAYYGKALVELKLHRKTEAITDISKACQLGHPIACLINLS